MATRARATTPLLFLLATSLLFSVAFSTSSYDEEEGRRGEHWLKQCVERCQEERPRYQQSHCLQECKQQQQPEWRHEEEHGRGHGRRGEGEREREEEHNRGHSRRGDGEREQEQEQGDSRRPYVFSPRRFRSIIQSDHGFVKALPPFHEESNLLRGIKNYRVAIMEVNPRSFVLPGFTDADGIGYVAQGEGVLTVIENGEKRSYKVRQGDVIVAPAGSLMHLANTDGRRKLVIAKILNTISVPGKFQFFSAEPLVASLSKRVQRAAFKKSYERLEKLLDRQGESEKKKDFIVRASEEQLRDLSRQASEGGQGHHWPLPPFRGDSQDTFNLLEQRPKIANRHGRLYEADARTFRALADQNIRVAVANITAGSMTAPYYNTQSFKFAVVLDGEGEVEIVCPHLSQDQGRSDNPDRRREREQGEGRSREDERRGSESEEEDQQRYQTIRARVSRGSAFVVPPGHPVVEISSSGASSNLQVVCFEIRARNNDRVWLAGKNNVIANLDSPAKVLTFGAPAKQVDEVFRADDQQEEGFLPGPEEQSRQQEREQEERHRRRRGDRGSDEGSMGAFLRMATSAF